MRAARLFVAFLLFAAAIAPVHAVNPDEVLADSALESRARNISSELRCLVCQNQSIDISDADLARDLRIIVRERLTAGDTDAQVIDFVVSRYSEFVLLKPRFSMANAALWLAPVAFLLIGGFVMLVYNRRRGERQAPVALTSDEEKQLAGITARGQSDQPDH
jgi:cytochrome c-type biogenesis protein CcmH